MTEKLYLRKQLEVIEYFSRRIFELDCVDDILWEIAENCVHRLDLVDCVIYLKDPQRLILEQKAAFGKKKLDYRKIFEPIEIPLGDGIVGAAAISGKTICIPDVRKDERYIVDDEARLSELAVPIICDGEVIGVIDSEHHEEDFFNEEHIRTIENIASICANKIAKEQLVAEHRSQLLFYQLNPNPVLRVKRDGSILLANKEAKILLDNLQSNVDLDYHKQFHTCVEHALDKRETHEMYLKGGETHYQVKIVPFPEEETVNVYAVDVTAMIKAREEAIAANNAKAEFLSVMSHEMRTPLHAILALSELILKDKLSEMQSDYLNTLRFSGQNLLSLVNDVLDFEKLSAGKMHFAVRPFKPATVFTSIFDSFLPKAKEKKLDFTLDLDFSEQLELKGDELRLVQIVNNLLANALKFTQAGSVRMKVEWKEKSSKAGEMYIDITDTGPGIPEEAHERIFDAFEQVNRSAYKHESGTGLGLAITRKLVELQKGGIKLHSVPGIGTTFHLRIPYKQHNALVNEVQAEPDHVLSGKLRGRTVLVVDDNEINLKVAKAFLELWGVEVKFAENGAEAIDKVRASTPDIVLMDIQMPGVDGLEATKVIRTLSNGANLPIIGLTADISRSTELQAYLAGMNKLVSKPFDGNQLLSALLEFESS